MQYIGNLKEFKYAMEQLEKSASIGINLVTVNGVVLGDNVYTLTLTHTGTKREVISRQLREQHE